jgi:hypothetical protein
LTGFNAELTAELLPHSHNTIRNHLESQFADQKEALRQRLSLSPYKKHLSFDIWTSPSNISYLAIFVHYADRNGNVHHELLAIPHIDGSYSGKNQARYIVEVIKEYGLEDQIGYFQGDNIDSNTKAVKYTLGLVMP